MVDAITLEVTVYAEAIATSKIIHAGVMISLDGGEDKFESASHLHQSIGLILEGDVIPLHVDDTNALPVVAARQVELVRTEGIATIVHVQVVIAVELELVET